jgi:glycosyltransferase involved in cell wall biosynthesis
VTATHADPAPDVSVLVAVLDEIRFIDRTAEMIGDQDYAGAIELLFIDGGSADGTRERLAELAERDPRVRLVDNPRRTQVAALNIGLSEARGRIVVQMDAHTFYPRHYLSTGVSRLGRGDTEWVSGPPLPVGVDVWSRRVAKALGSRFGTGGADKWRVGPDAPETELDTGVFAGFWLRSTLERLGGWDEGWPVNHDAELAARHLAEGGRIVCVPALAAEYVPRDSLRGLWKQYGGYGYYRVRTARRHPRSLRPSHLLSAGPALAAVAAIVPHQPLRAPARAALGVYGAAALTAGWQLTEPGERRDATLLAAVFAAMHFGWAFGFLRGCLRFGLPVAGIRQALGTLAARLLRR